MSKVETTQLLVAGGGPVGLFAALCAARRGWDVTVVERSFRGTPRGHTTLLHPSSLRLLQGLGLSPLLLRSGQLIEGIRLRVGLEVLRLQLPYPALAITQSVFEETLLKALRQAEVDVRATCEVSSVDQCGEHVDVGVVRREQVKASARPELEEWELVDAATLRSSFVIGADGRASHVRGTLGIPSVYQRTERFAMFEFSHATVFEPELIFEEEQVYSIAPLAEGRARCSFQLGLDRSPSPNLPLLDALLTEHAPWYRERPIDLDWSSIVDFQPAVAEAWGRGRVWLAGDAAHTTSPLGVQSMNRGLSEVFLLIEEMVSERGDAEGRLERLATMQRRHWLGELGDEARFELGSHAPAWVLGHARRLAAALPVSETDLETVLNQLGIRCAVRASQA